MFDSRRSFLSTFSAIGALALLAQQAPPTIHQPINMPPRPDPGEKLPSSQGKSTRTNNSAALVAHEKELREMTDQLLIRVQEFRAKLDGTHTADIFSVSMYKATEDIEKLAAYEDDAVAALHGWRAEVFGNDAKALRKGDLAIALENGEAVVVELEEEK